MPRTTYGASRAWTKAWITSKDIEELGLDKNTIVIYCSDQGFYIGDHGWYDKRWMYDESLKMPFIVKWPGVTKPGSRNTDLIQNLDYAQTFLELAGAKLRKTCKANPWCLY